MKIFSLILDLLAKIFSFKASKQERDNKTFEIKNSEEFRKKEQKQKEVARQDDNERIVAGVTGDDQVSKDALDEIRKRLGQ